MGNEFTWRKVSDEEKGKIALQAKKIMENFSLKLEKINLSGEENFISKGSCLREEGTSEVLLFDKDIFLKNAPKVSDGSIFAEKGEWVKK
jgi:Asp-tRNA(Asn)/Glu-tRNA(Gln) amidotransferase C subunit